MLLIHILQGTPVRIWALLAGLVALGLSQARPRTLSSVRATTLPAAMLLLSLAGTASSFGASGTAFLAWLAGSGLACALVPRWLPGPRATWNAAGDRVDVAGSWLPLALIVGLFAVKYVAGASRALHPEAAGATAFVATFGFFYGLFAATFAVRGWQLWSLRRATASAAPGSRRLAVQ